MSGQGRLASAIRVQGFLDPFKASKAIATVDCRPSVEFYA
jgi:hypothetical protein